MMDDRILFQTMKNAWEMGLVTGEGVYFALFQYDRSYTATHEESEWLYNNHIMDFVEKVFKNETT